MRKDVPPETHEIQPATELAAKLEEGFRVEQVLVYPTPPKRLAWLGGRVVFVRCEYLPEDEKVAARAAAMYENLQTAYGEENVASVAATPVLAEKHGLPFGPDLLAFMVRDNDQNVPGPDTD